MLSTDSLTLEAAPETTLSEHRLAANRANAQLSTGPRTIEGKARSSLNAVKTGLTGHAVLLADAEQAAAYRAHLERVFARWEPVGDREHTLVQSLADTQWRLNSIPGLESALYANARLRGVELLTSEDPLVRRLLLDAQTEVAEARALKNLRLQEGRLRRQYKNDEKELKILQDHRQIYKQQQARLAREQEEREREEQQRPERRQKRAARQQAREAAVALPPTPGETVLLNLNGFEFATAAETDLTHLTAHKETVIETGLKVKLP